ncbi:MULTISPECIES: SixA phosphatase family protein [unclassified Undibacterium]|uniref:SixA phosphatase family protein n=1 Tax=unclassified Undibacterium TaxID=2630295 RepID=UPI002AC8A106|nr:MULTISPECIES: histidine phosphatase family protein [unclassified Undibacterium]MEB0139212.1 histidine phosphatase family protein [Undibacterium sp. CCC2.1]MEB0172213.1 histidine phosphatase family protein [Undibacterium sp. CCC1.1]MEB0175930.1 histidine phosphatase family protein [Undibacterium sp. CCC3.4]MEB0215210.1 histidine phosphatase family protein [Undibacterium sp. 5I2]WPX43510.1 histidine phosphatase family protein [Undibacterium sp. CCC3.4]
MDLILWRHAEAELAGIGMSDAARKLTGKGIKQAAKMALWLDSTLPDTCRVLVSPALRTRDTAEALAARGRKIKLVNELQVDSSPLQALEAANWPNSREPVLLVGHQPYLGQIVSFLLHMPMHEVAIKKGNIWWISQKQDEDGSSKIYLKAVMAPELVLK